MRALVAEISGLLLYEATADLALAPREVRTPLARHAGTALAARVAVVPVLRAGLGMVGAALALLPDAYVWHIGIRRDERTLEPRRYYPVVDSGDGRRDPPKQPAGADAQVCLVLDPMLATGGSAAATIDILKRWGATKVKYIGIVAAPVGVATLAAAHPDVPIHLAAIDERLNDDGYIVPGLGDAGDRQFGT